MSVHNHAIVWVDHRVAKVFYLGLDVVDQRTIHADLPTEHLHHKANTIGSGKIDDDPAFFPRIDDALQYSEEILIVGPGNEKTLLLKYLEQGRRSPVERVLRAEACDHPTDREIIALGRRQFRLGEPTR
jgi:hypothetical protein